MKLIGFCGHFLEVRANFQQRRLLLVNIFLCLFLSIPFFFNPGSQYPGAALPAPVALDPSSPKVYAGDDLGAFHAIDSTTGECFDHPQWTGSQAFFFYPLLAFLFVLFSFFLFLSFFLFSFFVLQNILSC